MPRHHSAYLTTSPEHDRQPRAASAPIYWAAGRGPGGICKLSPLSSIGESIGKEQGS